MLCTQWLQKNNTHSTRCICTRDGSIKEEAAKKSRQPLPTSTFHILRHCGVRLCYIFCKSASSSYIWNVAAVSENMTVLVYVCICVACACHVESVCKSEHTRYVHRLAHDVLSLPLYLSRTHSFIRLFFSVPQLITLYTCRVRHYIHFPRCVFEKSLVVRVNMCRNAQ